MLVCALSGVDGSGKTTLAGQLAAAVSASRPDLTVGRLWLRYAPRRRSPAAASTVSAGHSGHPAKRLFRRTGFRHAWVIANAAVYRQQLSWQLEAAQGLDVLIADRFVLDFLADQIAAGMLTVHAAPEVAQRLPGWDVACVASVDHDELRRRCKPGDDVELLLARADLYSDLARRMGIRIVDGRRADDVLSLASEIAERR